MTWILFEGERIGQKKGGWLSEMAVNSLFEESGKVKKGEEKRRGAE
jgi:hypothetical protein